MVHQIGDPLRVFDIRLPSRHGFDMLRIDHKSFKTADPSGYIPVSNTPPLRSSARCVHPLASAPRGGSCAHPDQSRGLARRRHLRAISGVGASSALLLFFLGGGVALHERLVGVRSYLGVVYLQLSPMPTNCATRCSLY